MSKFKGRIVAMMALMGILTLSTACYGPFNLTKNVYHWNGNVKGSGDVNSKWMREIIFFGMFVLPVYEFSALLDAFVFNSIHFWTGDSPIKSSTRGGVGTQVATLGETTIRWTPAEGGATVSYERLGAVERRGRIVASTMGYRLVDEQGNLLSEAEFTADGNVRFLNNNCRVVNQWSLEQLRAITENHVALFAVADR